MCARNVGSRAAHSTHATRVDAPSRASTEEIAKVSSQGEVLSTQPIAPVRENVSIAASLGRTAPAARRGMSPANPRVAARGTRAGARRAKRARLAAGPRARGDRTWALCGLTAKFGAT